MSDVPLFVWPVGPIINTEPVRYVVNKTDHDRVVDALREQNRGLREALQIAIQRLNEGMHGKYDTLFAHGGDPGIVSLCKAALTATSQEEQG